MQIIDYKKEYKDEILSHENSEFAYYTREIDEKYLKYHVKRNHIYIATKNNKYIGHILVAFSKKAVLRIYSLVVDEKYRCKGIGSLLITEALKRFDYKRAELFCKTDNDKALKFYTDLGFENKEVVKRCWNTDCDAFRMVKDKK